MNKSREASLLDHFLQEKETTLNALSEAVALRIPQLEDPLMFDEKEDEKLLLCQIDWLVGRLLELDEAMKRLGEGSLGTCDACGGEIEPERLELVPETLLCEVCARKNEGLAGLEPPSKLKH